MLDVRHRFRCSPDRDPLPVEPIAIERVGPRRQRGADVGLDGSDDRPPVLPRHLGEERLTTDRREPVRQPLRPGAQQDHHPVAVHGGAEVAMARALDRSPGAPGSEEGV